MPIRQGGGADRPELPLALMSVFIKVIMPVEPKPRPQVHNHLPGSAFCEIDCFSNSSTILVRKFNDSPLFPMV